MDTQNCPKCGSPLSEITETPTGRKLQRCSTGRWNPETKRSDGCDYVLWIQPQPQELDEKCPKCGANLVLQVTRFGKKMKKCSTGGWDKEAKQATGCDFIEWLGGERKELDNDCPDCGAKLVLQTTSNGKRMEKCSTSGWDSKAKQATGCTYIRWLKPGEEPLPPEPQTTEN